MGRRIEWAANGETAALQHVGVDHGGLDVFVAEQFLDRANVIAVFEEVGGEGVAERMAADAFGDPEPAGCAGDGALEPGRAEVVAVDSSGERIA